MTTQDDSDTGKTTGDDTTPPDDTEQEQPQKDRDIDELLKLTTYQGMTDTEIQKVIDYKTLVAVQENTARYEASASQEQARRVANGIISAQKTVADTNAAALSAAQKAFEESLKL